MLKRKNFLESQVLAIPQVVDNKRCVIWKDMGLGKTVTALTAFVDVRKKALKKGLKPPVGLVVAPPSVARNVWSNEVAAWKHLKGKVKVVSITGTAAQREAAFDEEADIYVVSNNLMVWLGLHCNAQQRIPYNWLIIDESSHFRYPGTKRSVVTERLAERMNRVTLLTASPTGNGYINLWQQYKILDNGKRLGASFSDYKTNYFNENKISRMVFLKPGAKEQIQEAIRDVTFRYDVKDYLNMPKLYKNIVPVQMPKSAQKVYDDAREEFLHIFESGEVLDIDNAMLQAGKLNQIASGSVNVEIGRDEKDRPIVENKDLHSVKLDALKDLLESMPDRNVIIIYNYKSDREKILKNIKGSVWFKGQTDLYDLWRKNPGAGYRYVGHPKSMGDGLNLQPGGNQVIFYTVPMSAYFYEQVIGRVYRQGQTESVSVNMIMSEGTSDYTVYQSVNNKLGSQAELLNAMKKGV